MKRRLPWLLSCLALACDSEATAKAPPDPALQCVVDVCAVLVERAPIVPNHRLRWAWDWRTPEACLATMGCGSNEAKCRGAVQALPQIGPGSTPEASDGAIYRVWHACRDISGAGGLAPEREKR